MLLHPGLKSIVKPIPDVPYPLEIRLQIYNYLLVRSDAKLHIGVARASFDSSFISIKSVHRAKAQDPLKELRKGS